MAAAIFLGSKVELVIVIVMKSNVATAHPTAAELRV